jgi:Zn-finger nucleic acid-binding protein
MRKRENVENCNRFEQSQTLLTKEENISKDLGEKKKKKKKSFLSDLFDGK